MRALSGVHSSVEAAGGAFFLPPALKHTGLPSWQQCRAWAQTPSQRLVALSPRQMDQTPAPAAPLGAAGGEWGCADHPATAFLLSHHYHHPLCYEPQISRDLPPYQPSEQSHIASCIPPMGYPTVPVHSPRPQSKSVAFLQTIPSSAICISVPPPPWSPQPDPWSPARHTSHTHHQSVLGPPGAPFTTVLRSFHFSFIHLVKKQLLGPTGPGTNC